MNKLFSIMWKIIDRVVRYIIKRGTKLFHFSITEETENEFMLFLKFSLVGVSNTIISYTVYVISVAFGLYYMIGNALGFILSVLNSFYWNNNYVFKAKNVVRYEKVIKLIKTFITYGITGIVLSSILLYLWIDILNVSKYIAPILNLLITVPLNYLWNRVWTFKRKDNL